MIVVWAKPRYLLRIRDLATSLGFYGGLLEWETEEIGETTAMVRLSSGSTLLLSMGAPETAATTAELASLDERWRELVPGKTFYAPGGDLSARHQRWQAQGSTLGERPTGWELTIADPDGYLIAFWEDKVLTDDEILHLYAVGPTRLREAVAGLTEADLDLSRAPGKWTIRQLAHHITDSDFGTAFRMRFALAEPGRSYNGNPYNQDTWAEGLDYAGRPIEPSLNLFTAVRQQILGLCKHLPGALDRSVQFNGQAATVRHAMQMVAGHALGHIEQIWETRRVHNK